MNKCLRNVVKSSSLLALLLPTILFLVACQRGQADNVPAASQGRGPASPARKPAVEVATDTPAPSVLISLRTYSGEVRARDQVALNSRISARIEEVKVRVGDRVQAGDVVVVLDHRTLDAQVRQAEAVMASKETNLKKIQGGARLESVAAAQAELDGARAKLDALLAGAPPELIAEKKAALASARAKLAEKLAGPTREQIKAAENEVELARRNRVYQEGLSEVASNVGTGKLSYSYSVRGGVLDYYDQQVQIAADKLEALKAPPGMEVIAQLKAAVDQAQAQLDALTAKAKPADVADRQSAVNKAQAQFDLAKKPYTEYDLALAQSEVVQARSALQVAQAQQAEAYIRAPVDGYIISRELAAGAWPAAGATIVTMVSRDVEVVFSVEEKGLSLVGPGMQVAISAWAGAGSPIKGQVTAIAPAVNRTTRTFDVYVAADSGGILVPGMFVTVNLPEAGPGSQTVEQSNNRTPR